MKRFNQFILFNLLATSAATVLAHGGHGGVAHSVIGVEQLFLAFMLVLTIYPLARLVQRKAFTHRFETLINAVKRKLF